MANSRINKSELYQRKGGTPLVSSEDVERIKEVRQKRYKQEQVRRLKRKAKPIKKKNISKINKIIQNYEERIKKYQKDLGKDYREKREYLRGRKDEESEEWYKEEVKELEEERYKSETKLEAYKKGLKELKEGKKKYEELGWEKVLANEEYVKNVIDYADDVTSAEIRKEERKRKYRRKKKEYSEEIEELTKGKLKPDEYAKKYAELPDILQGGLLAPGGTGGYKGKYEKAVEKAVEEAKLTPEEKKKVEAWMNKNKMTPNWETIQKIIKKPIEKPERTILAYKNVITGEVVKKSFLPGEERDPLLRPIILDEKGKELPPGEQIRILLQKKAFGEATPEEKSFVEKVKSKGFLPTLNEELNEIRQKLAKKITKNEAERTEERINQLEESKETLGIGDDPSLPINKVIKNLRRQLQNRKKQIKAGVTSPTAQLGVVGAEIAFDFAIPVVGIADLMILVGSETEKTSREIWDKAKKWMGGKEITTKDLKDIKESSVFSKSVAYTREQVQKVVENIKEDGLIDGLKKSAEKGIEEGKDLWQGLAEFWTKASAIEEMKTKKKELLENKNELKKNKNLYEIESYNSAIKQYEDAVDQIDENIFKVKNQRDITRGTTFLVIGSLGFSGLVSGVRRRLRNIELGKYEDAIKRYNQLKDFSKNDVRLVRGGGVQEVDSYTGNFEKIEDMGVLKKIEKIENIQKIDIIKDSQVFVQRNPVFKAIDVPDSLKNIEKSKRYYLTYLPDALTPEQINMMSISKINSIPGYKTYWKNALTYNLVYKDGSNRAFSLIARSNKPLPNFRKPINAIKYGADKKIVLSSKINDEIIKSHIARIRGGRFYYEDTFFTRGGDIFETRRPARVSSKVKRELTPEEYWTISPRKSVGKTKIAREGTRDINKISPESFFLGTQTRKISRVKTVTSPIVVDTGALELALRGRIRALSRIKKSKLNTSQKALKSISNKLDNAFKQGKGTIKLSPETINKLENIDIQTVRNAAASVEVSPPTTKIPKSDIQTINNVNKELTSLSSNLNKIKPKINKVINNVESKRFMGTLNKKDVETTTKSIDNLKKDIKSNVKNVEKNISKSKQVLKDLEKNKQKYSSAQVQGQINRINQAVTQAQRLKLGYRLRLKQLNIFQNQIITPKTSIISPPSIISPTPRPPSRPPYRGRIPSLNFPGTRKRTTRGEGEMVRGYQVEVRRGGRWIKIGNPTTKDRAQLRGIRETGITLAQSFRIRPTTFKVPKTRKVRVNLKDYYRKKTKKGNLWIEKAKAKIDTPQEKRALKSARRSAEDYWLGGRR